MFSVDDWCLSDAVQDLIKGFDPVALLVPVAQLDPLALLYPAAQLDQVALLSPAAQLDQVALLDPIEQFKQSVEIIVRVILDLDHAFALLILKVHLCTKFTGHAVLNFFYTEQIAWIWFFYQFCGL